MSSRPPEPKSPAHQSHDQRRAPDALEIRGVDGPALQAWWQRRTRSRERALEQRNAPRECSHGPSCMRCADQRYGFKVEAGNIAWSLKLVHEALVGREQPVCDASCPHVAAGLTPLQARAVIIELQQSAQRAHERWRDHIESERYEDDMYEAESARDAFLRLCGLDPQTTVPLLPALVAEEEALQRAARPPRTESTLTVRELIESVGGTIVDPDELLDSLRRERWRRLVEGEARGAGKKPK